MTTQRQATTRQPQPGQPVHPQTDAYQREFVTMALTMSWRLALVVIVPIVGGNALDKQYHLFPWLTLAGLAVAAIGVFGVMHQTVMAANRKADAAGQKRAAT